MTLPHFRYHPDPVASGSVAASPNVCQCCGQARGYIYRGPVYAEQELEDALCPWCIADGTAAAKFEAQFLDEEALDTEASEEIYDQLCRRTPGYNSWQTEQWPMCCNDATAFLAPVGLTELRRDFREREGPLLSHILYEMKISGRAGLNLLESLHRDAGPTAYLFECLHCRRPHFHVDQP